MADLAQGRELESMRWGPRAALVARLHSNNRRRWKKRVYLRMFMSMLTSLNLVARIGIVSAYAIAPHQSEPQDICNVYSRIVAIESTR